MMSGAAIQELLVLLRMKDGLSGPAGQAIRSTKALESGAIGMAGGVAQAESRVGVLGRTTTSAGQAMGHFGGVIGGVARSVGMFAVLGGAAAIGGAIKSATDFQAQMTLIGTQAGANAAEVSKMTDAVLKMSTSVATGPEQLATGLYHIESVGFRGAKALDILKISAMGAKIGMSDLETTTNALVAAMYSGIKGAETAQVAMSTLDAIVGSGNMRMNDLVSALNTGVLPAARVFGLTLKDVGGMLAVLSDQGVNATLGATRLRMSFSLLAAPTHKAATELKSIGVDQYKLANDMRKPGGAIVAFKDLYDHMVKAGDIFTRGPHAGELNTAGAALISRAFGGGRSSSAIMTLLDSQAKLALKQIQINKLSGDFAGRWAETAATSKVAFDKLRASIDVIGIVLGNVMLPALTDIANAGADFFSQNADGIVAGFKGVANSVRLVLSVLGPVVSGVGFLMKNVPGLSTAFEVMFGAAILGKTSSVLFGKNPFTWAIGSVLGKLGLGGKGGAAGAIASGLGVTHVWVDNMGPGGMGGGAAGAVESKAGMLATVMSFVPAIIAATVAVGLYTQVLDPLNKKIQSQVADNTAKAKSFMQNATLAQLQNALKGVQAQRDSIDPITAALDLNGARSGTDKIIADLKARIAADEKNNTAGPGGSTIGTPQVWVSVRDLRAALMSPKIKDVGGSANILTKEILSKSGGSIPTLESIRSVLQRQMMVALKKGDIVTVNIIAGDIAKIGTRIDTVTQQRLAAANASRPRGDFIGLNPSLGLGLNLGPRRDQAKQPDVTSAIHTAADTQNRAVAAMKQRIGDLNTTTATGLGTVAIRVAGGDSILVAAINAVEAAVRSIPGINISPRSTDLAAGGQYPYGRTPPGVGARPGSHPGRGGQAG